MKLRTHKRRAYAGMAIRFIDKLANMNGRIGWKRLSNGRWIKWWG